MARAFHVETVFRVVGPQVYLIIPLIIVALLFSRAVADIGCVLTGLGFIAYSARTKNWDWVRDPVVIIGLLMLGYFVFVVAPLSLNPAKSLVSGIVWIRFIVFYAAVVAIIGANRARLPQIVALSLGILALAAGDALYQYFSGASVTGHSYPGRLTGPLDRPNIGSFLAKFGFATFALVLALASYDPARVFGAWRNVVLGGAVAALIFVIIVLSGDRTATIVMMFCLVIVIPGMVIFDKRYRKWALGLGGLCAVILVGLVTVLPSLQKRLEKLSGDLSNMGDSAYGQLMTTSLAIMREHPLTGIGFKQFEGVCKAMMADGLVTFCAVHPHNPYVDVQVVGGAIALLLFVALVVFLVFKFLRSAFDKDRRLVAALGLSAVTMTMFPVMFSQSIFSNWPGIVAWLSIAIAVGALKVVSGGPNARR